MTLLTGASSEFSLTGRDNIQGPSTGIGSSNIDAIYFNVLEDALVKVENYGINLFPVDPTTARGCALSPTIQRWYLNYTAGDTPVWTASTIDGQIVWEQVYTGSGISVPLVLPISPAFLEDAGLIPTQTVNPSNPTISLQQASQNFTPSYGESAGPLIGSIGSILLPPWTLSLQESLFWETTVRLIGATGQSLFLLNKIIFLDGGNGITPLMCANLEYSPPSLRGTTVPSGTFEITLIALNWVL